MDISNIWDVLTPLPDTIEGLQEDYKRGITPELPFFIIGQKDVTDDIEGKLKNIDTINRLSSTLILGEYGNGKTNLLKYLDLYCKEKNNPKILVSYKRANVDKPDIFLTLLSHIEYKLIDQLLDSFLHINEEQSPIRTYSKLISDFNNFEEIKDYVEAISKTNDESNLKNLIFLGTGRLYTKASWAKFNINQLNDFERREIFVFFLNVLSHSGYNIIFEIDELEKIREKSKVRFRNFLTSFRELLDLSKHIHGHLLLVAMTAVVEESLKENEAFYSRMRSDIKTLNVINQSQDQIKLYSYLGKLFNKKVDNGEASSIIRKLKRQGCLTNRSIVSAMVKNILKEDLSPTVFNLSEDLDEHGLKDLYDQTYQEELLIHEFKDIQNKFFDPLEYYIVEEGHEVYEISRQNRLLSLPDLDKAIIWNFSEATLRKDIQKFIKLKHNNLYLVKPGTYNIPSEDRPIIEDVKKIDFSPEALFILLEMFQLYPQNRNTISDMIVKSLNNEVF